MTTDSNGFNHTNEQEHKDICSAMIGFMDSGKPASIRCMLDFGLKICPM